jgi:hypothetical protein
LEIAPRIGLRRIYLFYTIQIDWPAVYNKSISLTGLERLIKSDATYWSLPVLALACHFALSRIFFRKA